MCIFDALIPLVCRNGNQGHFSLFLYRLVSSVILKVYFPRCFVKKHQHNPLVSAWTVCHWIQYIMPYIETPFHILQIYQDHWNDKEQPDSNWYHVQGDTIRYNQQPCHPSAPYGYLYRSVLSISQVVRRFAMVECISPYDVWCNKIREYQWFN